MSYVGEAPMPSRQQFLHHPAMHVGQPEVAAGVAVGELRVIETEQVQNRGVEVVHVNAISRDRGALLVGLAVGDASLGAAAGHP